MHVTTPPRAVAADIPVSIGRAVKGLSAAPAHDPDCVALGVIAQHRSWLEQRT